MRPLPSFEEYLASLGRLSMHIDPTGATPESTQIIDAAESLTVLPTVDVPSLTEWARANPLLVPILGLTVGLSQERLKTGLQHRFGTGSWVKLARTRAMDLVAWLDEDYDLVRLLSVQRSKTYGFGDVLVARAGSRARANQAGAAGRRVEDEIEAIAQDLGLPCETRTRFTGRNGQSSPCDLVIPHAAHADIVVAAKGFDSTGSKLTDTVREIEEMAQVRLPSQYVMAVIDGIGWKSRQSDLRRIYALWESRQIDGMYTLASLDDFRADLEEAARRLALL